MCGDLYHPGTNIDGSAGDMTQQDQLLRARLGRGGAVVLTLTLCLGLAACGTGASEGSGATATAGEAASPSDAPGSASATPTPSATLSAKEQEAFEQATQAALAFSQTITDLYSGTRSDVNDMYFVATSEIRERVMNNIARGLSEGTRTVPQGVEVTLIAAKPVKVQLERKQPRVIVRACIDATKATDIEADGTERPGVREELDYWVVKVDHLPEPGWAVTRLMGQPDQADRAC
jgi:hypothetical protein